MDQDTKKALIKYLATYITQNKLQKIEQVLPWRTRYVTVVLEDIYQSQNASAVLRTCESFGIQDVHIIENHNMFKINREVTQGAQKWLTILRYIQPGEDNTKLCLQQLKTQQYRLIATTPDKKALPISKLNLEGKMALMFGNEESGLSQVALELADTRVCIPMYGFTQSFNISVSVAIVLSNLIARLHHSKINWRLSESEALDLKLHWIKTILKRGQKADKLIQQFLTEMTNR